MFNIKNKIKQWLLKDELAEIESLKQELESLKKPVESAVEYLNSSSIQLKNARQSYDDAYQLSDRALRLVNEITDVSVDIGFHDKEHSWAVVCIAGKFEYLKFIPLNGADARTLLNFLKQFRYSNRIIDSPFGFRDMISKELFYK